MEAAGRTVMFIDIPEDRIDLREKFHPDHMPVWRFIRGEGDTFYEGGGFPITPAGRLKFNFRAKKASKKPGPWVDGLTDQVMYAVDKLPATSYTIRSVSVPSEHSSVLVDKRRRISIPRTSHTHEGGASVPLESLRRMKEVIGQNFPELAELGFSESRVGLSRRQTIHLHFN